MVDDYMLDQVLEKIKVIIDDTKILIDTDDELSDHIIFKNVISVCH